ncbi:MAG: sulfite exporter TauE/SafE family protein [Clostridia bacterium]|nr:sulfite exporter TauE/SafE family protein [Clostridia bacterium]
MNKRANNKFFLPIVGFLSGIANGLLGAGGGIIIVYGLNHALGEELEDKRDVFANALCVMLPVSAVSCILYAIKGNLVVSGIGLYAIPAILGGIVGGILLARIKPKALKRIFAALVIYSGIILIIR